MFLSSNSFTIHDMRVLYKMSCASVCFRKRRNIISIITRSFRYLAVTFEKRRVGIAFETKKKMDIFLETRDIPRGTTISAASHYPIDHNYHGRHASAVCYNLYKAADCNHSAWSNWLPLYCYHAAIAAWSISSTAEMIYKVSIAVIVNPTD